MTIPRINIKISDLDFNVNSIAELLTNDFTNTSLPFKERVFHAFPNLVERIKNGMTNSEIHEVVKKMMYQEYKINAREMEERKMDLQEKLKELLVIVFPKLLELFELEWPIEHDEITCYLGLYTVFPRNVITKEFWIHYKAPEEIVMRASIHEINHFILFEKWKSMHGYTLEDEPTHPDVLWFLEEMAIDPTLNTKEIQEVAPYPFKAYNSFYENTINEITIEDYIIKLFKERKCMAEFIDLSFKFIMDNHKEIITKCG